MQRIRQFKPDDATEVFDWGVKNEKSDAVLLHVDGRHGAFLNHKSIKKYILVEGDIEFIVENISTKCSAPDYYEIPAGKVHVLVGNKAKAVCMAVPPFDPEAEEVL